MSRILIYHNGECSKSTSATQILKDEGIDFDVRYYLLDPLNEAELRLLVKQLGIDACELVRRNEPLFIEKYSNLTLSSEDCIKLLAAHPELMQRPIAVNGEKAIIARPPEKILDII